MRAAVVKAWGSLEPGELPDPRPGKGEVLIAVKAAGVNFADTLIIGGKYQEKPPLPFSPGLEVAGEIVDCGPDVTRLKKGDRVMGTTPFGGFAERAVGRESACFVLPKTMSYDIAAGFPVTYGTAHGSMRWYMHVKPGESLVVHGAGGGVGLAAVECGKAVGARVIATAGSDEKLALARAHGADETINYATEDLRERIKALTGGEGADAVFDPVGGDAFDASLRSTAWGGRIAVIGFASGKVPQIPANILLVKNLAVHGVFWGSYRTRRPDLLAAQFAELFQWYEAGKLKPHVSHRVPLAEAPRALELLTSRKATGKVVVTI
ncbi:MAG: NADPH:quinone oxidoreductase family protein [Alphaproteobacteria bacterium]|nr:NADPH:quinone oxidoreductase family protein [Alphaproteobacteria bacterium]